MIFCNTINLVIRTLSFFNCTPALETDVASKDSDIDGCGIFWKRVVTKPFFLFQLKRFIFLKYNSDLIIPLLKNIQGFSINYRKKHQVFDADFVALPNQSPDPASLHSDFSLQGPSLIPHSWMLASSFSSLDLRSPGLLCHCVFVFIISYTSKALPSFPS